MLSSGVTQTVPVTLTVGGVAVSTLVLDSTPLNFDYQQGGQVPGQIGFQVTSTGGPISFNAAATTNDGGSWLRVSPTTSATPTNLAVSVDPANLAAGNYTGTISVSSSGATNSPQTKTVTLVVRAAAVLAVNNTSMQFTSRDGAVPGAQTLSVASSGDPISFNVSVSGGGWLSVTPSNGTTPANLSVAVNPAGLVPRIYTGQITLQGTGGTTTRQVVDVTLTVAAPLPTSPG